MPHPSALYQPVKLTPLACRTAVADLVVGVSTAVYSTFSSRAEAVAAYDAAVRKGEVSELRGDQSYVVV